MMLSAALLAAGLAAGALLNCLADDLPPDAQGARGRLRPPHCQACSRTRRPALWLALAGLLLRRNRCEHCGAPRPARHAMVELSAGAGLALLWAWAGGAPARFLGAAIFGLICLLVSVIDIEHRLILHVVSLPAAVLAGLAGSLLWPGRGLARTMLGGLAGFGLMLGLFLLGLAFTAAVSRLRGRALGEVALGGGDVNLAGVIGLATGWPAVILALLIAILAAGAFSLGFILFQAARRRYTPFTPLPFGPFLALGGLTVFLYGREIALWLAAR